MAKDIIVEIGEDGTNKIKLVKRIDESYLHENFGHLLEYMLDCGTDPLNRTGYDSDEEDFANRWRAMYDRSMNSNDIEIDLVALVNATEAVSCPLHRIVGDYTDRIVREKDRDGVKYMGIDLIISDISDGGYE